MPLAWPEVEPPVRRALVNRFPYRLHYGATSSLFLVQGGVVYTPPLALGVLPGIARDRVLACCEESGIPARERLMHIHDAYAADELFLTSSVRLIVPVCVSSCLWWNGVRVGGAERGPVTQRVAAAYRAEVERL